MTAVEPDARPDLPVPADPNRPRSLTAICPYLAAVDGEWRSASVAREHRCHAVAPPAPLAADKQRRLCLTADYPTCATFEAARAARPVSHDRLPPLPRPLARVAPVVMDHGRLALGPPRLRADRTTVQAVLVTLLVIAFVALVLARLAGAQVPAGVLGSPSAGASGAPGAGASSAASVRPASRLPVASAGPSQSGEGGGSAAPGSTTYKVKVGDTLVGIAARYGTTPKAIADLNGIADPASLRVGQVLQIP